MQKNILVLASTLALVGFTSATYSLGACPKVQLQKDFNITRYTGTWFEQARDHTIPWEHGTCPQARYNLEADGKSIAVTNSEFNPKTGKIEIAPANATCTNQGPACKVKFNNYLPEGDYRVLSTDYTNYAIVYSCTDIFGFSKEEYMWVLTRAQNVSDEIASIVHEKITAGTPDFNLGNIQMNNQAADCQYLA
ncbi:apolipoprotein d [Stylonychia lemnae]|uniref:Apolipoprotein d n=1 Tax=Stylonychia lemnae TaxID=5949 RepID=A0A077ZTS2_STYLE|nr:apolipoprotein d [Stylonychia lemnae]|eukprot:CDW72949.1 apolipoprotein d [Stylonychia lemnae]